MACQQSPRAPLGPETPIGAGSRADFARHFLEGRKPAREWRTGLEVEFFGFTREGWERAEPDDLAEVISAYAAAESERVREDGLAVGARAAAGELSLEPGGQFEFSSRPLRSLVTLDAELRGYLAWLAEAAAGRGLIFLGVGFDPLRTPEEQRWVMKRRYRIMRPYLRARGARAWDMMCRTAAVQANLDYDSEADLARKFVAGNLLAPVASAIFAHSPFREGRLSGLKSERVATWLATDPDRCGVSPAALDGDFSLDRFLDYLLAVPMLFVRRGQEYLDFAGLPFGAYLTYANGVRPIRQDFLDHLTTIFTEARLKQIIELRSADGGGAEQALAVQAFWKGLLYHPPALDEALRLAPRLDGRRFRALQANVARDGLSARLDDLRVLTLAQAVMEISTTGLKAIAPDEVKYLAPVEQLVLREEICPADILIKNFTGSWHGDIGRAVEYLRVV